jgi:exonuclease VII small subunit
MDSTEWQKKSEETILKLTLISNVKKIFLKASLRVEKFKQEAPSLSLPPKPVLTCWGTWLDAAMYYCENYSTIEKIVSELESKEASSVKFVKKLFSSDLSGKLAYIKSNFLVVSKTIARLEAVGVEMNDALDIVKSAGRAVEQARGKVAENVKKQIEESAGAKLWVFSNM